MSYKTKTGEFCWTELLTKNPAAAKKFYGGLFGWEFQDDPIPGGGVFSMIKNRGDLLGAMYDPGDKPQGWLGYVQVDNADETAERVKRLGGKVIVEPRDVGPAGRMAWLTDNVGANFGVWQPAQHTGRENDSNTVGAWCWAELYTSDKEGSTRFYTELFNWKAKTSDPNYVELNAGPVQPNAGIFPMTKEMQGMKPGWRHYFLVEDVDAAANKASSLGGKILMTKDIEHVGRFAYVVDTTGAELFLFKLSADHH